MPTFRPMFRALTAAALAATAVVAPSPSQESAKATAEAPAATGPLRYPRDADRVIAEVAGKPIRFRELVDHVKARHDPHFDKFLATPGGSRCFTGARFGADWVRQFADLRALQAEAQRQGKTLGDAEPALAAALKDGFQVWAQGQSLPEGANQELIDSYLARYQRYYGLSAEVEGWLAYLVPYDAPVDALRDYYADHPTVFGGYVSFAHILVRHRDANTLQLLEGDALRDAYARLADIRSRLSDDGDNFREVAAQHSDDRATAARGGLFENVKRFHPTLPAALCRAAWDLRDGQISEPVESPYGLHLIQRINFNLRTTFLFTPGSHDTVKGFRAQNLREDALFGSRARMQVRLRY